MLQTSSYKFWIAGPKDFEKPRVVVHRAFKVEGDVDENEVLDDIEPWLPDVPEAIDPSDPDFDPPLNEETKKDYFFLANRIYYRDDGSCFVYEEPYGKWEGEFKKAMLGLELELELKPSDNGEEVYRLVNKKPLADNLNFNGWKIVEWTVESSIPLDKPEFTTLIWDFVVWKKSFAGKEATVTIKQGWRIY